VLAYAIKVDPCTGVETERQVGSGPIKPADVRNKFVVRFKDLQATAATRKYRFKTNKGAMLTNQGIQAGKYVSPITELVWPEVNVPGTSWPANMFNQFSHLANGFVFENQQYGPLRPFPMATTPTPYKICTGNELNPVPPPAAPAGAVPVAFAGGDFTTRAGTAISLQGRQTNANLVESRVKFSWKQTLPATENIVLTNENTAVASFIVPSQTSASTARSFVLTTCLVSDATKCSTDDVIISTDLRSDIVTITSYQYASKQNGTITVVARSNVILRGTSKAALSPVFNGGATVAMIQITTNGGLLSTHLAVLVSSQPILLSGLVLEAQPLKQLC
jgi:hypothetical protein